MKIFENDKVKLVRSRNYNYYFNKITGEFVRWGETIDDDPVMAPAPEICDMEISTICDFGCSWCYKSNTSKGENMSFETFKKVFHKLPKTVNQIAYGIGSINSHPDLWKIMEYTRANGIIPNITINGKDLTKELAQRLANVCGAVSVSRYDRIDVCYDAVQKLTDAGLVQTNLHQLLCVETYDSCFQLFDDIKNDERLSKLNAVVFLMLKSKGKRNKFHLLTDLNKFDKLIKTAQEKNITIGMDSCTGPLMLKYAEKYNQLEMAPSIEPCESFGLFSSYINTKGLYFPCSFAEGEGEWKDGIDVVNCEDFVKDIWFSDKLNKWREKSLNTVSNCNCSMKKHCRACPIFNITPCQKTCKE